jgi:PAS domain S-box-containing protein
MEETLRESEALHRSILTNISDTVFITDNQGKFTFICPNVEVIFGYSWVEVLEMGNISQLLGKDIFDEQELENQGEITNIEREIKDKIGEKHSLLVNVKRVSIKGETVLYSCRDITDLANHKLAEKTLRESEERFRSTFEQAAVGMLHYDLNGRFLRVNQKFCDILGYSSKELLTRTLGDITFPDDLVVNENYGRLLLAGEMDNYSIEQRYISKQGPLLWGNQTVSVVSENSGEPKYFVAVVSDISESKLVEEALRLADFSFERSAIPAFWIKRDASIIRVNDAACRDLGYSRSQLQSMHVYDLDPDFPVEVWPGHWEELQQQKTLSFISRHRTKDGKIIPVELTLHYLEFNGEEYNFALSRDISERKQAEELLQQQMQKERLIGAISQRIHQSLNLEEILNITVAEVRQFLACDRVIIFRLDTDGSGLVVVESVGSEWLPISGTVINDRHFAETYIQLYQQGRVQAIEDISTAGLTQCHIELLTRFQVRANLVVPIVQEEKLWGLLVAQQCGETRQWQQLEIDLLKSLATQTAIAIQQAELYKQSRTATVIALTQAKQLEEALQKLQKTQAHLVQSEKMSSLGQLVAGVAHEINNPVSFIYGNLTHASGYTQDILGLLDMYRQCYPNPLPEIQEEIDKIDLDFLIEDLPKILDSMKVGSERICEIVRSLRSFSRLAEAEMKAVDIHEGIDSTLMILQNRLKAQGKYPEIKVIKDYGNLPKVECYAGQLNQVFMNLLTNAIDAIYEQNQKRSLEEIKVNPSIIKLHTEIINDQQVAIKIADNGPGMTQQVKQRLFDPFFTTKPIGVGTGLGLSISYQIVVEKHQGKLHCLSEVGQGTEFVIEIPLRQNVKEPPAILTEN